MIKAYAPPKTKQQNLKSALKKKLGLTSVFDITGMTEAGFKDHLVSAFDNDEMFKVHAGSIAGSLYNDARCYAAQISHLYREQRTSDGTAQHQWHPLGIRAIEKQGPTYTHLFKENWDDACKKMIRSPPSIHRSPTLERCTGLPCNWNPASRNYRMKKTNRIPLAKTSPGSRRSVD